MEGARLRVHEDAPVERRVAADAGNAGVQVPERVRTPAVAVAAGVGVGNFRYGRAVPLPDAFAPEVEAGEEKVRPAELEIRGEEVVPEVDGAAGEGPNGRGLCPRTSGGLSHLFY